MADIFDDAREALARAEEHIKNFDSEARRYIESGTSASITETKREGAQEITIVKYAQVPVRMASIACDAVNNLRMALDRLGYATATATGKENPEQTYFPFTEHDRAFDNPEAMRRSEDVPHEVMALFRTFKPYKGGNDLLWALNRIANINKHRLLVPVLVDVTTVSIFGVGLGPASSLTYSNWDRTKRQVEYAVDLSYGEPNEHVRITFDITFDQPDVIRGQPAVRVLGYVAANVRTIIEAAVEVASRHGYLGKKCPQ